MINLTILESCQGAFIYSPGHARAKDILVTMEVGPLSIDHHLFHQLDQYVRRVFGETRMGNRITIAFHFPSKGGYYYLTYQEDKIIIGVSVEVFFPKQAQLHYPKTP